MQTPLPPLLAPLPLPPLLLLGWGGRGFKA